MTKLNEQGRSMVEMLGVLAIIGVLSVMGIMGFKSAMTRHLANELLNEGNKRATVVAGQIMMQSQAPSLHEFTNNTFAGGTFDTVIITEGLNNRFGLKISEVDNDVCEVLVGFSGEGSVLRRVASESDLLHAVNCQHGKQTYVMIYNNDMGGEASDGAEITCPETPGNCPLNAVIAGTETQCPCVCPEHREVVNGRCGACQGIAGTWTQPTLNSTHGNGTMGVDDFAVAASSYYDNRDAWKAFDSFTDARSSFGINNHEWHSKGGADANNPQWLSWYTVAPIQIQSITITNRDLTGDAGYATNVYYTMKDFAVQYSDDNSNWTTIYEDTNPMGSGVATPFTISATSGHQYWRLLITSGWRGAVTIGELDIEAQRGYTLNPSTLQCE